MKAKLKQELDRLSNMKTLLKLTIPNGVDISHRCCYKKMSSFDPKPLNSALKRNVYPLLTIGDVLPMLSKARVFTALDAKNGLWHIQQEESSSYVTTFGTPWGRFRWLRLSFCVSLASEEFQRGIDIALE